MNKILIQLPNTASTSKYPKYFPQPLNLSKFYRDGDKLIDLSLLCYKKKKEDIFKELLKYILFIIKTKNKKIIINAGDYPADAAYSIYYEFFFKRLNLLKKKQSKIITIGTYSNIFYKHLGGTYLYNKNYMWAYPNYFCYDFKKYPKVNKKYKVSIRASVGCPRNCTFCPVPIHFGKSRYKFFRVKKILDDIQNLYESGARYFTFIDDNISASDRFIRLLKKLYQAKLKNITFNCQEGFEVSSFSSEIAYYLKELKFDDIKIGIENINKDFRKKIGKYNFSNIDITNAIKIAKKNNLKIKTFFLMEENMDEKILLENLKFFAKHHLPIRTNILRNYRKKEKTFKNINDQNLKTLCEITNFFNGIGINIFKGEEELKKFGYKLKDNTISGRTKFGFKTRYFEKGIEFIFKKKVIDNDGEKIILQQ